MNNVYPFRHDLARSRTVKLPDSRAIASAELFGHAYKQFFGRTFKRTADHRVVTNVWQIRLQTMGGDATVMESVALGPGHELYAAYQEKAKGNQTMVLVGHDEIPAESSTGRAYLCEEKVQGTQPDCFVLEEWGDKDRRPPGWTWTNRYYCDYIAFLKVETGRLYMVDPVLLRKAWMKNWSKWTKTYAIREQDSGSHVSTRVAVPIPVVFAAMAEVACVEATLL